MAYLMDSLITSIPSNNVVPESTYGFNMVAERCVYEGTLGEINMMADPAMTLGEASPGG